MKKRKNVEEEKFSWHWHIETPFSESEITKALGDLVGEKAPGFDGFPIRFYQ